MIPIPLSSGGIGPLIGSSLSTTAPGGSVEFADAMRSAAGKFSLGTEGAEKKDLIGPVGKYVNEVNRLQMDSQSQQAALASGQDVDLHNVMIAAEKAAVSLQLTVALRNKLLDAYQEVMRMQV